MDGSRKCPECKESKSITDFYVRKDRGDRSVRTYCKPCTKIRRERYPRNYNGDWKKKKLIEDPEYDRKRNLWKLYRITLEEFNQKLAEQGGVCGICEGPPMGKGQFHVDHSHDCCNSKKSCGKCIRGLLCHKCNVALGMVLDDVSHLKKLIDYLGKWEIT